MRGSFRAVLFVVLVLCTTASAIECSAGNILASCETVVLSRGKEDAPLAQSLAVLLDALEESFGVSIVRIATDEAVDDVSVELLAQYLASESAAAIVEVDIAGVRVSNAHLGLLAEAMAVRACLAVDGWEEAPPFRLALNGTYIPAIAKKAKDFGDAYLSLRVGDAVSERKKLRLGKAPGHSRRVGGVVAVAADGAEARVAWRGHTSTEENACNLRRLKSRQSDSRSSAVAGRAYWAAVVSFATRIWLHGLPYRSLTSALLMMLGLAVVYRQASRRGGIREQTAAAEEAEPVVARPAIDWQALLLLPPQEQRSELSAHVLSLLEQVQATPPPFPSLPS